MTTRRGRPRNAAARARIIETATRLFVHQGYLATTVGDIAAEAEVAVQTIYSAYQSKVGLLATCIDIALAGDDEPVPLAERDWFRALDEEPSAADAWLTTLARMHVMTARVAPIYSVMLAAEADPDVESLIQAGREQRAEFARLLVEQMAALPGGEDFDQGRVADLVYATESVESYALLVTQRGWSLEQWHDWVRDVVLRELNTSGRSEP